jgi:diaminopimelate decarboxylase
VLCDLCGEKAEVAMGRRSNRDVLPVQAWGADVDSSGRLLVGGCSTVDLAKTYGTPLHVVNRDRLAATALEFRHAFECAYPGKVCVHYAFKCNGVPAVVETVRAGGLKAEVMSEFELDLALRLGFPPSDIIVNGPCKPDSFLTRCIASGVRLIVVDSLEELEALLGVCTRLDSGADILLRVNPNYTPRGMNQGASTGSRKACAFGLDLAGGEVDRALARVEKMPRVRFRGFHVHIGTGIRDCRDYDRALRRLAPAFRSARTRGLGVEIMDVGGGFAASTTREMTTREMLLYQGWERLPTGTRLEDTGTFAGFGRAIASALSRLTPERELPELIVEPGRSIASSNQLLLLTVHRVKERPRVRTWLITDGGLGTVSMPTYYEYHEVFLCNDVNRPRTQRLTIVGPVCFAADVIYKNKPMPEVAPGEVLAVMDSGAYFTAMESSFGFPRPAIVAVSRGHHWVVRRRETYDQMIERDRFTEPGSSAYASGAEGVALGARALSLTCISHRLSSRRGGEGRGCKACDRGHRRRIRGDTLRRPTERNAADTVLSGDAVDSR